MRQTRLGTFFTSKKKKGDKKTYHSLTTNTLPQLFIETSQSSFIQPIQIIIIELKSRIQRKPLSEFPDLFRGRVCALSEHVVLGHPFQVLELLDAAGHVSKDFSLEQQTVGCILALSLKAFPNHLFLFSFRSSADLLLLRDALAERAEAGQGMYTMPCRPRDGLRSE